LEREKAQKMVMTHLEAHLFWILAGLSVLIGAAILVYMIAARSRRSRRLEKLNRNASLQRM